MSKRGELAFINDMLEAIKRIITYTENMDYEAFMNDLKTRDVIVRNLEIIG